MERGERERGGIPSKMIVRRFALKRRWIAAGRVSTHAATPRAKAQPIDHPTTAKPPAVPSADRGGRPLRSEKLSMNVASWMQSVRSKPRFSSSFPLIDGLDVGRGKRGRSWVAPAVHRDETQARCRGKIHQSFPNVCGAWAAMVRRKARKTGRAGYTYGSQTRGHG